MHDLGGRAVTKTELVESIFESGAAGDTRVGAERAVEAVLRAIARGLRRDRKVQISGFGAFHVKRRGARVARNPRTGETIQVSARRTVAFRAGERLKSELASS